jgi:glucosylceramidase
VDGDLQRRYFDIERDKQNIIPHARTAQKYSPQLQLFRSPCPPNVDKITHDYPMLSSQHKENVYRLIINSIANNSDYYQVLLIGLPILFLKVIGKLIPQPPLHLIGV